MQLSTPTRGSSLGHGYCFATASHPAPLVDVDVGPTAQGLNLDSMIILLLYHTVLVSAHIASDAPGLAAVAAVAVPASSCAT